MSHGGGRRGPSPLRDSSHLPGDQVVRSQGSFFDPQQLAAWCGRLTLGGSR